MLVTNWLRLKPSDFVRNNLFGTELKIWDQYRCFTLKFHIGDRVQVVSYGAMGKGSTLVGLKGWVVETNRWIEVKLDKPPWKQEGTFPCEARELRHIAC